VDEHWIEGQHGPIRCWVSPAKQGVPILLIHGYGGLIEHWRRVFPILQQEHTPYAFDLYNLGYSARLSVAPSKELWATQAAQVIDSLIGQPALVVGHSMGGMVGSQLARDYPHLVRGLVVVNSMGLPREKEPGALTRAMFGIIRAPLLGDALAEVVTNSWMVRQSLLPAYYNKDRVTPDLVEAFSGPLRQPGRARDYLAISRANQNFVLDIQPGQVQVPKLIIWGAEDRSMPATMAPRFQEEIFPDAGIKIIPETAHCPFDEAPETFCEVLLSWMENL
jgi:pimeloyl-ACP methyl ester carboxylesterase